MAAAAASGSSAVQARVLTLGIDIGTSTVCVARADPDGVHVLYQHGDATWPTLIAADAASTTAPRWVFGDAAREDSEDGQRRNSPPLSGVKQLFGRDFTDVKVQTQLLRTAWSASGGPPPGAPIWRALTDEAFLRDAPRHTFLRPFPDGFACTPEDIMCALVDHAAQEAVAALLSSDDASSPSEKGPTLVQAVLTVPAYYTAARRTLMRRAAEAVGVQVLGILTEPTAAALAAEQASESSDASRYIMVFDWGGGTLDVSVLLREEDEMQVLAIGGNATLGGRDLDHALAAHCEHALRQDASITPRLPAALTPADGDDTDAPLSDTDRAALREVLYRAVRRAKHKLQRAASADVLIQWAGKEWHYLLTRAVTAAVCQPTIDRATQVALHTLDSAGVSPTELSTVLAVGGTCRGVCVQAALRQVFGDAVQTFDDCDTMVARGAAWQAAGLVAEGDASAAGNGLVLQDVLSHTIGLAVQGSQMFPLLEQHTPLPATRTETLTTYAPAASAVTIELYQGQDQRVQHNARLGSLRLTGLPQRERGGVRVYVTVTAQRDGSLIVTAHADGSPDRATLTLSMSGTAAAAGPPPSASDIDYAAWQDQNRRRSAMLTRCLFIRGQLSTLPDQLLLAALDTYAPSAFMHDLAQDDPAVLAPTDGGGAAAAAAKETADADVASRAAAVRAVIRQRLARALAFLDSTPARRIEADLAREESALAQCVDPLERALRDHARRGLFRGTPIDV